MATALIPNTFSLANLAAAQQAHEIFAHSLGDDAETLARLRSIYARKRAELAALMELFDETTPDLVLRAADGRQVVLRLPAGDTNEVVGAMRAALSAGLLSVENQIVEHLQQMEQEAELRQQKPAAWNTPSQVLRAPILTLCAPSDPALLAVSGGEWARRTSAAEAREEALQQEHNSEHAYGREILWHPSFPAEYVAVVSERPLAEIAHFHTQLADWANQGRALDQYDYSYLADVLREALASQPTELATLRLRRALNRVEQATTMLLPAASAPDMPTITNAA